jgi:hypothetical protein
MKNSEIFGKRGMTSIGSPKIGTFFAANIFATRLLSSGV